MILGFDYDQVTSDTMTSWLNMYNKDFDDNLQLNEITSWEIQNFVKEEAKVKMMEYIRHSDVFKKSKPIRGAIKGIDYLKSQGHKIIFITVNNPNHIKERWLKKYNLIDNDNQIFVTENKKDIVCDFLIDDKPENLLGIDGIGILFTQPHNANYNWFPRANNWKDIIDIIEGKISA
jgi:5'(3')-deoxyribonucleotidase